MKKELKTALMYTFDAPSPSRKKEFLENLNYPKTRWKDFIMNQLGYIQKKVWVLSVLLFCTVLLLGMQIKQGDIRLLWSASAFIPFLALLSITEITRSIVHGMVELEMTTRYSLRSLLLVRMGILGIGNLFLLFTSIPLLAFKLNLGMVQIGVYLLVPYLLTCFISLTLVTRFRSEKITYYCAGVAVAVSGIGMMLNNVEGTIYQRQYYPVWVMLLVILIFTLFRGIQKFIKNMEELLWNSYLTA